MAGTLDERYVEFSQKTAGVFASFEELETLRYFVFKQLLTLGKGSGALDTVRHLAGPVRRRERTALTGARADILLWVESPRDLVPATMLPVHAELRGLGLAASLVSAGARGLEDAVEFSAPSQWRIPRWAVGAFDGLVEAEPSLKAPGIRKAFRFAAAEAEALISELERVLAALAPSVVAHCSMQMRGGAALTVAARRLGVPVVLLQHGVLQPFYTPVVTDAMVTWGETSNEVLELYGAPRDRLKALGSPRHDHMEPSTDPEASRAALCSALGLPARPTIMFYSNGNDLVRNGVAPAEAAEWLGRLSEVLADDVNVVVRLHPNEDGTLYRNAPRLHVTKSELDLHTTIDGSDCVASLCSTVLCEGVLYGKPVWQFEAPGWPRLAENWRQGIAEHIASAEALTEATRGLIEGPRDSGVNAPDVERVFANHGTAAKCVSAFLASFV